MDRTAPGVAPGGSSDPTPDPEPGPTPAGWEGRQRRSRLWLVVLGALLLVGAVVAGVLVLGNQPAPQPAVPEADVVTLPVPSPTVEAIAREPGTAFYDALPSTFLAYALAESGEDTGLLGAGALEAYRLVYSDGGDGVVTVRAAQWATPEGAAAAFEEVLGVHGEAAAASGGEQEDIEIDGVPVGRYLFLPRDDGTGTVWWTNETVLVEVDGPADAVRDAFAAFPF